MPKSSNNPPVDTPKLKPGDAGYVGHGHPPVEHRFKKGAPSPNPKGRPRKGLSSKDRIRAALAQPIQIAGGRTLYFEAYTIECLKRSMQRGNPNAIKVALELCHEYLETEQQTQATQEENERWKRILEDAIKRSALELAEAGIGMGKEEKDGDKT